MIDWLTMRHPINSAIGPQVQKRLLDHMDRIISIAPDGSKNWEKQSVDFDAIRSDAPGLFWTVQGNATGQTMLTIGASPASLEHGINVFGSSDIRHCADVLLRQASKAFETLLPNATQWECRRLDVTQNYDLGASMAVKQALRYLMATDSARRKATSDSKGGDSVYWSKTSDLISGKAYHKGPQLAYLVQQHKTQATDEQIQLANRLLRLELKLGSRWFRRLEAGQHPTLSKNWLDLTPSQLDAHHDKFFSQFIGRIEVADMTNLLPLIESHAPTPGQALAAHRTWAVIRSIGYDQAKASMSKTTWCRHLALLRASGLSDADISAGNVIPLRRTVLELSSPVTSWSDLRRAA